jgi:chemotaxis protein CheD
MSKKSIFTSLGSSSSCSGSNSTNSAHSAPGPVTAVHVLHPGDVACASQGERLETLLGSCVAIILTDPRRTVGAMCHIVHSRAAPASAPAPDFYADSALASLYALLRSRAINPSLCEAYVYGGGNMFPQRYAHQHVGEDNADWALQTLARERVRVLSSDLGGNAYRRLSWVVGNTAPQVIAVPV